MTVSTVGRALLYDTMTAANQEGRTQQEQPGECCQAAKNHLSAGVSQTGRGSRWGSGFAVAEVPRTATGALVGTAAAEAAVPATATEAAVPETVTDGVEVVTGVVVSGVVVSGVFVGGVVVVLTGLQPLLKMTLPASFQFSEGRPSGVPSL